MFSQKAASFASASWLSFILSSPPFWLIYGGKLSTSTGPVKLAAMTARPKVTRENRMDLNLFKAGGLGVGQFVWPAIGAEIVERVTEANRCFIWNQIDAVKTTGRQLIRGGAGNAVHAGAELRQVKGHGLLLPATA
jgi:hypothetical protein